MLFINNLMTLINKYLRERFVFKKKILKMNVESTIAKHKALRENLNNKSLSHKINLRGIKFLLKPPIPSTAVLIV